MNFCVLGAGAWGTTFAIYLSKIGHVVTLVPRRVEQALKMSSERENEEYLPGISFDSDLQIAFSYKPVLMECDYLFFACPSHALRKTCEQVLNNCEDSWRLKGGIALCKGLEPKTNYLPHQVIQKILGMKFSAGYLTGPTYANEVASGKPAAMTLAIDSSEKELVDIQSQLSSKEIRIYRSSDRIGVGLGSSLKNIYAIATGISDGLELGDNARAALITRSMNEMIDLGVSLGGKRETFFGLSGFGDLVATSSGTWSRNRIFGLAIAQGQCPQKILDSQKTVVEGYWATECFYNKCMDLNLEMPILFEIYAILYQKKEPSTALSDLMTRVLKAELNSFTDF